MIWPEIVRWASKASPVTTFPHKSTCSSTLGATLISFSFRSTCAWASTCWLSTPYKLSLWSCSLWPRIPVPRRVLPSSANPSFRPACSCWLYSWAIWSNSSSDSMRWYTRRMVLWCGIHSRESPSSWTSSLAWFRAQSAISTGRSCPHSFPTKMITSKVSKLYRFPRAFLGSLSFPKRSYKLPIS